MANQIAKTEEKKRTYKRKLDSSKDPMQVKMEKAGEQKRSATTTSASKAGAGKRTKSDGTEEVFLTQAEVDEMEIQGQRGIIISKDIELVSSKINEKHLQIEKLQLELQLLGLQLGAEKSRAESQQSASKASIDQIRQKYNLKPNSRFRYELFSRKIIEE